MRANELQSSRKELTFFGDVSGVVFGEGIVGTSLASSTSTPKRLAALTRSWIAAWRSRMLSGLSGCTRNCSGASRCPLGDRTCPSIGSSAGSISSLRWRRRGGGGGRLTFE